MYIGECESMSKLVLFGIATIMLSIFIVIPYDVSLGVMMVIAGVLMILCGLKS